VILPCEVAPWRSVRCPIFLLPPDSYAPVFLGLRFLVPVRSCSPPSPSPIFLTPRDSIPAARASISIFSHQSSRGRPWICHFCFWFRESGTDHCGSVPLPAILLGSFLRAKSIVTVSRGKALRPGRDLFSIFLLGPLPVQVQFCAGITLRRRDFLDLVLELT
jgi:hypothetical protein